MTELSLQAQAVYDAYRKAAARPYYYERSGLVAALRAAADQVVPEEQEPVPDVDSVVEMQGWACVSQRQRTRSQFLAIAAELEGGE